MNVGCVVLIVLRVFDATYRASALPDCALGLEAEGESSFDELHGFLNGNVRRRREEQVNVIGHDDEGV